MKKGTYVKYSIEYAIEFERLSNLFYMQMAHSLNDYRDLKELFMTLAIDESVHEKQLRKLAETIPRDADLDYRVRRLAMFRLHYGAKLISGKFASFANLRYIGTRESALESAFDFETHTLEYYKRIKDALGENPVIEQIITFEKCHLMKVAEYLREERTRNGFNDERSAAAVG